MDSFKSLKVKENRAVSPYFDQGSHPSYDLGVSRQEIKMGVKFAETEKFEQARCQHRGIISKEIVKLYLVKIPSKSIDQREYWRLYLQY